MDDSSGIPSPVMDTPLHHLTVAEASALIETGKLSPVALTEAFLERIASIDDQIRSYILVMADQARAAAERAEKEIKEGGYRGPLHGIPYAVKDNYHAAGFRTCAGSRLMLDRVSTESAAAIERLEKAGAILLGKLNTWEYGTGNAGVYFDLPYPPARNPWNTAHFTGGSSSGAGAAVAAGTAMFALGTDTGGSVRLPAAGCGVQGIKPTLGRISRRGILPNCFSFDTPGPLAWSIEDCALVLNAIAGPDPRDPMCSARPAENYARPLGEGVRGLRVGYIADYGNDAALIDPEMRAAVEGAVEAFRSAGARIVPVSLPLAPSAYRAVSTVINWSESFAIHEEDYRYRAHLMGRALHEKMAKGQAIAAADYVAAQRYRRKLVEATDAIFSDADVVVMPTIYRPAPDISDDPRVRAFTGESGTHVWSLTGHPAATVRAGLSRNGLPLAVQFAGAYFAEAAVLRAAAFYEKTTNRNERPALDPGTTVRPGFAHLEPEADVKPQPPAPYETLIAAAKESAARIPRAESKDAEPADIYFPRS